MFKMKFENSTLDYTSILDKEELMRVKVWVCRAGDNSHGYPIVEEALDKARSTLIGKPFVAKYDKFIKDVLGHEVDEVPIGVFLSDEDIFFENDGDGQRWICAYATIWVRYAKDVAFVMERDRVKSVSMEMLADMDEMNQIVDFYFVGVTLIGVEPAIPMARAELMEFSMLSNKVKEIYFSSNKKNVQFEHEIFKDGFAVEEELGTKEKINIKNSKKDAVMSETWNGQDADFLNKLLMASNHESLVKEAYLIVDGNKAGDLSVNDVHYPHHDIKNGALVVNRKGVISAFQRAMQQGLSGDAISHLKRHYKELGLSTENFEEGGNSLDKDKDIKFEEKEVIKEEVEMSANENVDGNAQADTLVDEAKTNEEKSEEFLQEDMEGKNFEDQSDSEGEGTKEEEEEDEKEDFAKKLEEFEKLKEEHTVLMEELEQLRKFKCDYEEKQKLMAIEEVMEYVSDVMPVDMANDMRAQGMACDIENLTAWSNEVKARALEFSKPSSKTSFIKIGLNYNHNNEKKEIPQNSIWGKL